MELLAVLGVLSAVPGVLSASSLGVPHVS